MRVTGVEILDPSIKISIPLANVRIPCGTGFPSPADDYIEERVDLTRRLVKHPAATHCFYAEGDSMIGAGIFDGDILVVDRALEATHNKIIVARLNGELIVKRYYEDKRLGRYFLVSENPAYPPIEITPETDFSVWGVVTCNVHLHEPL